MQSRPDRLPLIALAVLLVALPAMAGIGAYLVSTNVPAFWKRGTAVVTRTARVPPTTRAHPRDPSYAGLTHDQAMRFATADFVRFLARSGVPLSPDEVIANDNPRLTKTRCIDAGTRRPYWRVAFGASSPIFESRDRALLVCNRNAHVVVLSEPLQH